MHKQYQDHSRQWRIMDDCYAGSEAIKHGPHSLEYLPPYPSDLDDMRVYGIRKSNSHFTNCVRPLIDEIVGLMNAREPLIRFGEDKNEESPPEVLDLRHNATDQHDGLTGLKQRVNFAQVMHGRYLLLLDVVTPDGNKKKPRFLIREYPAAKILDGETTTVGGETRIAWVLLDESTETFDPDSKEWTHEKKFRVLGIDGAGLHYSCPLSGKDADEQWREFDLADPPPQAERPNFKGTFLRFIPAAVVNVTRQGILDYQPVPFIDIANMAIIAYRVHSMYMSAVFNYCRPTLVGVNVEPQKDEEGRPVPFVLGGYIGVNTLPGSEDSKSSGLSFLEIDPSGLSEMREAVNHLMQQLQGVSVRTLLEGAGASASGEALRLRTKAGTATFSQIDTAGAKAIEQILVYAARWAGAAPEEADARITFNADTSYVGADLSLAEIAGSVGTLIDRLGLSTRNAYSLLEHAAPGVVSSFEDNDIQRASEAMSV